MQNYKLSFDGYVDGVDEQQSFIIYVRADSEQSAIEKVTDDYQATNINVITD